MKSKITDTDYDEYYAKKILEKYFEDKFGFLDIVDKPDLQNKNLRIGVEVTNAIEKDAKELEKLRSSKYKNEDARKSKIRALTNDKYLSLKKFAYFHNKHYPNQPKMQVDPLNIVMSYNDNFDLILESIKGKLKKINNGNYTIFKTNDIFIFSYIYANDKMIKEVLQNIIDIQKGYEIKFDSVHVLVPGYLYVLDLNKLEYKTIDISCEEQYNFAHTIYNELKENLVNKN